MDCCFCFRNSNNRSIESSLNPNGNENEQKNVIVQADVVNEKRIKESDESHTRHEALMNTESSFKTIKLCTDLNPRKPATNANQDELRDVIVQAARANEERLKKSDVRRNQHEAWPWMKKRYKASERYPVGSKTPALGSSDYVTYSGHDAGLFSTVMEAYNNHYNLRTGPEDWWYCIIQTVALAIDKNSKRQEVRDFFVQHKGKKTLTVEVGPSIYGVDYSWFFNQMSQEIAKNINVPDYVDNMKTDFSTSTKIHKIVGEVALMYSMQEFFEYRMTRRCGIPSIEMKGTQQDWEHLGIKIKDLRKTLEPLEQVLGLTDWWNKVENISNKLLDTFKGHQDEDWWSRIITRERYGSGNAHLKGWFMVDLLNVSFARYIGDAPSGLVSVPMTITDGVNTEQSAVVAGMIGFKFHNGDGAPAVEPVHGWSLLLESNSVFRRGMVTWEKRMS